MRLVGAAAAAWLCLTPVAAAEPFGLPANADAVKALAGRGAAVVLQHLQHHGFAVLGDQAAPDLASAYKTQLPGLPMLITSDALLQLWYQVQREVTEAAEAQTLLPLTRQWVTALWASHTALTGALADARPEVGAAGSAAALTLAVALRLADDRAPLPEALVPPVAAIVQKIRAAEATEVYPGEDYTQYRPRGPYDDRGPMAEYFRLAKWLGRRLLPLAGDGAGADTVRQTAWLVAAVQRDAGARAAWQRLATVRRLLAGPFALSSVDELDAAFTKVLGAGWTPALLDDAACAKVLAEVAGPGYTAVNVRTRLVDPSGVRFPTRAFALLPEHELPDARLMQQVIDAGRTPSGLDVAAALGLPRALTQVTTAGGEPAKALAEAAQRSWQAGAGGLFAQWLSLLATLGQTDARAPEFMRTAEWQDKTVTTVLASWAQLRHQAVLYAAGPYHTLGAESGPRRPRGLVEPNPAFFRRLSELADGLLRSLRELQVAPANAVLLERLAAKSREFAGYAELELAGQPLPQDGAMILQFPHWVAALVLVDPAVVADVATVRQGVLHAGSGYLRPLLASFRTPAGETITALGFVSSYYELIEPTRLTDRQWAERLNSRFARPQPPAWARTFWIEPGGPSPEDAAALRQIETDLLAGRDAAALPALRRLQQKHHGTRLEVQLQLLLARTYERRDQGAEAAAAYQACAGMYGCAERDAAAHHATSDGGRHRRELEQVRQQHLAELAATAPQPGLSAAAEQARQDRRARLLLRPNLPNYLGEPEPARVLSECPQSQLVPVARLWLAAGHHGRRYESPPRPSAVPALEQVERDYAGSLVAETAATWAAQALLPTDPKRAVNKLLPYVPPRLRPNEPWPAAADFLVGKGDPDPPLREEAQQPAWQALRDAAEDLAVVLLEAGAFDELDRLAALPADEVHGPPPPAGLLGLYRELGRPQAEALRLYVSATRYDRGRPATPLLEELVRRWPDSPLAPLALYALATQPPGTAGAEAAARALRERFPKSPLTGALLIAAEARAGRLDEAEKLAQASVGPERYKGPGRRRAALLADRTAEDAEHSYGNLEGRIRERNALLRALAPLVSLTQAERLQLGADLYEQRRPSDAWLDAVLQRAGPRGGDVLAAILATLPDCEPAADRLVRDYPQHPAAQAERWERVLADTEEPLAAIVDAGPTHAHYAEAVRELDLATPRPLLTPAERNQLLQHHMRHGSRRVTFGSGSDSGQGWRLELLRQRYEAVAAAHAGRPSATLLLTVAGELLLRQGWREQALEVLAPTAGHPANAFSERAAKALALATSASPTPPAALAAGWRAPLGSPAGWRRRYHHPYAVAVAGDTVYATTYLPGRGEGVVAVDRRTGGRRWQVPLDRSETPEPSVRPLAADAERLVVELGGTVVALASADGRLLWRWDAAVGAVRPGQVLLDGRDTLVACEGQLVRLGPDGRPLWQQTADYWWLGCRSGSLLIAGRYTAATRRTVITALDLATGASRWTLDPLPALLKLRSAGEPPGGRSRDEPPGDAVLAAAAATDGRLTVVLTWRNQAALLSLRASGHLDEAAPLSEQGGEHQSAVLVGRRLLVSGEFSSSGIALLEAGRAEPVWRGGRGGTIASAADGAAWVATGGEVLLLDLATATIRARAALPAYARALAGDGREVYVLTEGGGLYQMAVP